MKTPYDRKNTIQKAASLASGSRLNELYAICERQKTITLQSSSATWKKYMTA